MPTDPSTDNFEIYKMCRDEGKHEFDILAGRLNTFMTSQAFLVSAFAVSFNAPSTKWSHFYRLMFPSVLSLMGLILCVRALPGIISGVTQIRHWHSRQDGLLATDEALRKYYDLEPKQQSNLHSRDIWFAQTSPYIFGIAWVLFGCMALYCASLG